MRTEADRHASRTPSAPSPLLNGAMPTANFGDSAGSLGRVLGPSTPTIGRRFRQQDNQYRQRNAENRYASRTGFYGDRAMDCAERRPPKSNDGCCGCRCCYERNGGHGNMCWRCVARSSKVLLIVPNVLFVLAGIVLIAVGLWMQLDYRFLQPNDLLKHLPGGPLFASFDEQYASWVVIGIGCGVLLLSFIGCCGACAESAGFLCFYSILLLTVVGIEVVACIAFGVTQRQIQSTIEKTTRDRLRLLYKGSGEYRYSLLENGTEPSIDTFSASWDKTQVHLSCCGSSGPEDFRFSAWRNASRQNALDQPVAVPPSCCLVNNPSTSPGDSLPMTSLATDCQREAIDRWQHMDYGSQTKLRDAAMSIVRQTGTSRLKIQGCAQAMLGLINRNAHILLSIICGIIMLQVINMTLACLLSRWIRKSRAARGTDPWHDETDFY